jgi:hypothetical protein
VSGDNNKKTGGGKATETVAEYLARVGKSEPDQVEHGATGKQYPVKRTRRAHIDFMKGLDRKRLKERGFE